MAKSTVKRSKRPKRIQRPVLSPTAESKTQESFFPMLHGKATDAIATMTGKALEENQLNSTYSVTSGEVKLILNAIDKKMTSGSLGVSTHKLLSTAISFFTAHNHTRGKRDLRALNVAIPLKEYALMCDYDVFEHETETPEEAEKEALRAKRQLDNARRKINRDLDILFRASISWTEKVKGKERDYLDVRIIQSKGIRNGYIHLEFSSMLGEYLIQLPLTQYPVTLLGLDERNNNAYVMGLKMAEHYSIDNNQIKGTAQLLKVKTLLELTSLPSIEKMRNERRSWEERIKDPFENALDALSMCGLLEDWEYCHSKGVSMTDEEATTLLYEDWVETLVHFTLKDAPDHKERLESNAEARQTKGKKAAKKKEGD